ncbi:hypothetical protein SAMN05216559_1860 [Halomicrobium zhouii]|uniref:Uncharacterized protein n=1 Tax=Halomicrobium zhouii TaxID=767519 RepID=A0A1I6L1X7_9EURY|nr:hypothetical protein [Halomicrobium zhouii]SFR97474.1 hypothetical protein SAMN05216559_1860 [Halomicrobium zhouii]
MAAEYEIESVETDLAPFGTADVYFCGQPSILASTNEDGQHQLMDRLLMDAPTDVRTDEDIRRLEDCTIGVYRSRDCGTIEQKRHLNGGLRKDDIVIDDRASTIDGLTSRRRGGLVLKIEARKPSPRKYQGCIAVRECLQELIGDPSVLNDSSSSA